VKVLIVDPDAARAATVAAAFTANGAQPAVAPSASFALTMLEWNRQDVIISRSQLGDMDAHELCSMVRGDPSTVGVSFVLIASPVPTSQMSLTGVDLVIPDGLVGPAIVTRVTHLMRRKAPSSAAPPSALPAAPARPPAVTPVAPLVTEPLSLTPTPPAPSIPAPTDPVVAAPAVPTLVASPPAVSSAPLAPPSPVAPAATPPAVAPAAGAMLRGAAPPPPPLTELEAVGMNGAMRTFQGALGALALEDIARAIVKGTKTGRLLVVLGTGGGMLAFESGRIVHAEIGNTTGETAFRSLLAASHGDAGGKFCFIPSSPRDLANVPKTITRTVAELLAGAAEATNEER
jgi:CheY-like chemotaxis protein